MTVEAGELKSPIFIRTRALDFLTIAPRKVYIFLVIFILLMRFKSSQKEDSGYLQAYI